MHCDPYHSANTVAVEDFDFVELDTGEGPGIASPEEDVDRMWRETLRFLKSSLPRALMFLEAAVILSFTLVSSERSWAR